MTNLEMATIDELVNELVKRSDLFFIYHEFESSDGAKYHIRQCGDKMRMLGVFQARVIPDLIKMVRLADAQQEDLADDDSEEG